MTLHLTSVMALLFPRASAIAPIDRLADTRPRQAEQILPKEEGVFPPTSFTRRVEMLCTGVLIALTPVAIAWWWA